MGHIYILGDTDKMGTPGGDEPTLSHTHRHTQYDHHHYMTFIWTTFFLPCTSFLPHQIISFYYTPHLIKKAAFSTLFPSASISVLAIRDLEAGNKRLFCPLPQDMCGCLFSVCASRSLFFFFFSRPFKSEMFFIPFSLQWANCSFMDKTLQYMVTLCILCVCEMMMISFLFDYIQLLLFML